MSSEPLPLLGFSPPWMGHAKCRNEDPELFFPEKDGNAPVIAAAAKAVCLGTDGYPPCPVLMQCREWGLANEVFGIWGGLSERDRSKERRRRQRAQKRRGLVVVRGDVPKPVEAPVKKKRRVVRGMPDYVSRQD